MKAIRVSRRGEPEVMKLEDVPDPKAGPAIITSDHGNAEMMRDENGEPHTAHTCDKCPLIVVKDSLKGVSLRPGILADIAPTILALLGLPQPPEMTGKSLLAGAD